MRDAYSPHEWRGFLIGLALAIVVSCTITALTTPGYVLALLIGMAFGLVVPQAGVFVGRHLQRARGWR